MVEKPEMGVGVWTGWSQKMQYGFSLKLQMVAGNVKFMKDFICENPFQDPTTRRAVVRKKIIEQATRYRIVYTESDNPHSVGKTTLSGKVDITGKVNKSAKDDLFFSLSMALGLLEKMIMNMLPWWKPPQDFRL